MLIVPVRGRPACIVSLDFLGLRVMYTHHNHLDRSPVVYT